MVALANKVEKNFNVSRAKVDGKEMTDSEVRKVLKESKDSARRKAVWGASKVVGAQVSGDLRELVKLRNQAAVKLGFKNYHALQLHLNEQNGDEIIQLFDELDALTREPFAAAKAEIDQKLTSDYRIKSEELMPWQLPRSLFQESPQRVCVEPRRALRQSGPLAACPFLLCEHPTAYRQRDCA